MNLYWPIYKNLEKELITLAEQIHIDDNQLSVYSIKISELLIRTVVEIESISKEIYCKNGGEPLYGEDGHERNLFFDTDCLQYLEEKWILSEKKVSISHPFLFFKNGENKTLTPLMKANLRGRCDWKKAYQAVKHDRANKLKEGNLKHFIRALAALFILNTYNLDDTEHENDFAQHFFSSDIFSGFEKQIFPDAKGLKVDAEYIFIQTVNDADAKKYYELKKECITNIGYHLNNFPHVLVKIYEKNQEGKKYDDLLQALQDVEGKDFVKKLITYDMRHLNFIVNCKKIKVLNKNQIVYPENP